MNHVIRSISLFLAAFILLSGVANAQWVFVGRKALGKIKQLTGEATDTASSQSASASKSVPQQGYDAATVLLEAPADKVYGTAVKVLQANSDIRISRKDDRALSIEFIDGSVAAGMQITSLSETVSQILVVSTSSGKKDTSIVLKGILRICKEMGAHCQSAD
jgi:hypothetical protein